MRVLVLTHRLPYAPNRGDRIRAYHTLRTLCGHARVDLVSLTHDAEEQGRAGDLGGLADSVTIASVPRLRNSLRGLFKLASTKPLTHVLLDSPVIVPLLRRLVTARRPDVVYAYCSGMARFALEPPLDRFPLVVDLVDVDSLKWQALAAGAAPPLNWIYRREATHLSTFERRAARAARATIVVNDREEQALRAIAPDAHIEIVPSGVDLDYWRPVGASARPDEVVFCGVMNYAPNEEGAVWFATQVWPIVRRRRPSARLTIVGAQPTRRVRGLATADSSIRATGAVPDVRPFLWGAAVSVAPLHVSRGVQNKVLEAVAAGLPAVITAAVAAGLPAEVLAACTVAGNAEEFADAVVRTLELTPEQRRTRAGAADLGLLTWERRFRRLPEILHAAAQTNGPTTVNLRTAAVDEPPPGSTPDPHATRGAHGG